MAYLINYFKRPISSLGCILQNLSLNQSMKMTNHLYLKRFCIPALNLSNHAQFIANCSSTSESFISRSYDRDPAPLFFSTQIQNILEKLTGFDLNKIFDARFLEYPDEEHEYKFFTEDDLKEHMQTSIQEAKRLLQMPPIVQVRDSIDKVLSRDPALEGLLENTILFTDVSPGVSDRQRIIVARDPDGTLRQANWNERHRMNQIYNPRSSRHLKVPEIFEEEHLQDCLGRFEYKFILDFACAHFEPDDPLYHKVTKETYEHINMRSKHDVIESTRHYGPLCFYLAWHKKIDNLLIQHLHKGRLEDCVYLIKLYYLLKTQGKADTDIKEDIYLEYVTKYCLEESSQNQPHLQLAIQSYQEAQETKKMKQQENL